MNNAVAAHIKFIQGKDIISSISHVLSRKNLFSKDIHYKISVLHDFISYN